MPTRRHYTNNSAVVTTTGSMGSGDTTVTVTSASSFPASFPYTAVINAGLTDAEEVLVTGATGPLLTITRGYNGSAASTHATAATFAHEAIALDFDEANAHTSATSGVHGVSGNVVGDTDAQTLSNKTLAGPVVTGGMTVSGTASFGAVTSTTGGLAPTGSVTMSAALAVPSGWLLCDGSAVSRTTYAGLFAALAISFAGTVADAGPLSPPVVGHEKFTITVASTAALSVNESLSWGTGGTAGVGVIASVDSGTQVTVVANSSAVTGAQTIWHAPYGLGNGTTTFNVPNFKETFPLGAGDGSNSATSLGSAGGALTHSHSLGAGYAEINLGTAGSSPAIFENRTATGSWNATVVNNFTTNAGASSTAAGTGTQLGGSTDASAPTYPPYLTINFIIKS